MTDKDFMYKVESTASVENDLHDKLLTDLAQEGWDLISSVYKPPSRYSDGKFYFYLKKSTKQ